MDRRSRDGGRTVSVLVGRRLSRRAFLRAMAAAGITATVIPGGVLAAAKQADPGAHSPASRIAPDRIADLAAALYYDVDEIFRFVADSIRYEPYAGILRGADGTLVARAGNSADQAALLAALLDASLINHRFALGRLDAQAADSILASAVTDAATAEQGSLDALAGVLPGQPLSPAPELDPETRAALERAQGSADQVVDWAREQVTNTSSETMATGPTARWREVPSAA